MRSSSRLNSSKHPQAPTLKSMCEKSTIRWLGGELNFDLRRCASGERVCLVKILSRPYCYTWQRETLTFALAPGERKGYNHLVEKNGVNIRRGQSHIMSYICRYRSRRGFTASSTCNSSTRELQLTPPLSHNNATLRTNPQLRVAAHAKETCVPSTMGDAAGCRQTTEKYLIVTASTPQQIHPFTVHDVNACQ